MIARTTVVILLFVMVMTLAACQTPRTGTPPWEPLPPTSTPAAFDRDAEERAVYAALLQVPDNTTLVIVDTTNFYGAFAEDPDEYYDYIKKNTSGVSPELWADFVAVGAEEKSFPTDLEIGGEYIVISQEELNTIFINGNYETAWDTFRTTYNAMAYSDYSRVGFSPDHTKALVYSGFHCGDLCGSGVLVVLEKQAGEWQTVEQVMTWIS